MRTSFCLAITADLHWGQNQRGDEANQMLAAFLHANPPDALILAGDIGTNDHFAECLALFDGLACRKALVPGNHDVWVTTDDPRGDSLRVYEEYLPALCEARDFHYLDRGPLLLPEVELALVGSINWYDYSWSLDSLRRHYPAEEHRLSSKRFTRGRHNDANFVRWPLDDKGFTARVVAKLERDLDDALATVAKAIVVTHHPAFQGLSFPRPESPPTLDGLLWEAFGGNRAVEEILLRRANHIPFVFCGHTHRERESTLGGIRGYNVGGDYHFKRLLLLDWPAGTVEARVFGDPTR